MAALNVKLHPKQLEVFNAKARFKVVAAGRRFGKTRLAIWTLLIEGLKSKSKDVFYVAPTFQQAKDIVWDTMKELGHDVIATTHENTGVITLINGRKIYLKGSDRPDTMRGVGLAYCVIDEYADMKPFVFEQILRPALSDVKGGCLFIGTPKGRNHFYDLFQSASSGTDPEWAAFHYTSKDNPFLDDGEIDAAQKSMSSFAFRQEFLSSFEASGGELFKADWIVLDDKEPQDGDYYIAVDLAGFANVAKEALAKNKRLDETAIAVVKVHPGGWWVKDIICGRWDVRECALRILKAAKQNHAVQVGIEKGSLKNAVMPYLFDTMRRVQYFPYIQEVTHGNQNKTDRIVWSLQGRFEHGKVKLNEGEFTKKLIDQILQFPDTRTHDDMVDALSYIDQLAITPYYARDDDEEEEHEVFDEVTGW